MNPNDIPDADWMFRFIIYTGEWLNPTVYLIGLAVAAWAFCRCRKPGYLVMAIYFGMAVFTLLAMPSINRAMRAHRLSDISEQTRQKIDVAVREATDKVLAEAGHPVVPTTKTVRFPFGPILLVTGLWLVARREARTSRSGPALPDVGTTDSPSH